MAGQQLGSASESWVKQEWAFRILPAFRRVYPDGDFPAELMVVPGRFFDGFGSPGLVAVDEAVVAEVSSAVRLFALAHETGHCVAYLQCEKFGLTTPNTENGPNKKKHEMMADLIAMRVLQDKLPSTADVIRANYNLIAQKLGAGDSEHPSGHERVKVMKKFTEKGAELDVLFNIVVAGLMP